MAHLAEQQHETEIHDHNLKIPSISNIISNDNSLLIDFAFVQQAVQSVDNQGDDQGGHGHKHGDEVFSIRKELQFQFRFEFDDYPLYVLWRVSI